MSVGVSSCGSEVVMLDGQVTQAENHSQPVINSLNVIRSSGVHIGPKFVSVTQNVDKTKVVKDLPFHRYIWHIMRSTTIAERVFCVAAILALLVCVLLVVYFTVIAKNKDTVAADLAHDEWFITKDMWLATKRNYTEKNDDYNPLRLVIIAHTVSAECHYFVDCAAEMRSLQTYFLDAHNYDIPVNPKLFKIVKDNAIHTKELFLGLKTLQQNLIITEYRKLNKNLFLRIYHYRISISYNFLIGNDGRVYEGRGFNIVGAHTVGYNSCSMGLAFVGDYREGLPAYTKVTPLQVERAQMLFEMGVKEGYLHPQFNVLGAMDLQKTLSPGTNLYKEIQKWPNYGHKNLYANKTCKEIQMQFQNKTLTSTTTILPPSISLT